VRLSGSLNTGSQAARMKLALFTIFCSAVVCSAGFVLSLGAEMFLANGFSKSGTK